MRSLRMVFLALVGWILQAQVGHAQALQMDFIDCAKPENKLQAMAEVKQRVTLMKIAASKADFMNLFAYAEGSNQVKGLNVYLNACSKVVDERGIPMDRALCDADCYVQRAQAFLFMVSELPYLDAKKNVIQKIEKSGYPKDLNDLVGRGLGIVETGLNNLSRMNQARSALKPDPTNPQPTPQTDSTTSDSFRGFLQDQARLQAVKVRLMLALGDRIYQNVSRTRVATLKKRLNDVLDTGTQPAQQGSELYQAETLYEQAFWILQEALIDMPKIGLQAEAFTLMGLKNDVDQRLTSVRSGFLFLNIDPEHFSTKTADELMDALQVNLKSLEGLEDNIEQIVKNWQSSVQDQDRRKTDNDRLRTQKDLEVDGYKIAELSSEAESLQGRYSQLLTTSTLANQIKDLQTGVLEKKFMMAQLNFELEQTKAEVQGQIDVLRRQADLEVTALNKEAAMDRRDNYKWLIDMTLTQFNLNLQIKQLEAQIQDLSDQIGMKDEERKTVAASIGSQRSLISMEESHIAEIDQIKAQLEAKKGAIYLARRQGLVQNICALLSEKARLIGSSEGFSDEAGSCNPISVPTNDEAYWTNVIAIRKIYFDPDANSGTLVANYKKLLDCLTEGKKCDGKEGEIELINKAWKKEKEIWDATTKPNLDKLKKNIEDQRTYLKNATMGIATQQFALAAANLALGAVWVASAGKKVTIGITPGVEVDLGEQFQAVYEVGMNGLQGLIETQKYYTASQSEIMSLSEKIAEIDNELATVQANWDGKVKEMQANQAIAAIAGRRLELERGQETLKSEYALAITEAKYHVDQADAGAKRIDAEIAAVKAQLQEARAEKDLLTFDLNIASKQADQSRFRIQSMQFEIQGLQAQQVLISKDAERLGKLKDAAVSQQGLTAKTLNSVEGLAKNVTSESEIVKDLRNKEIAGQTALSQSQVDRLEAVLIQKTDFTAQAKNAIGDQIKILEDQISKTEETKQLTAAYNLQLNSISSEITALSKSIVNKASLPDPSAADERTLFLASEDMVADLTQGIPDFMAAKRQRLHYTNFLFNLLRNRINTINTIGNRPVAMDMVPFITGSSDLSTAMQSLCKNTSGPWVCDPNKSLAFAETEVIVRTSEFAIPATSGFMSRLISKGQVRFEITPYVARLGVNDRDAMASSGYFMLWDGAKMSDKTSHSLVDIVLRSSFEEKDKCRNSVLVKVKHLGTGIRFETMGADREILPTLITRPPVQNIAAIFESTIQSADYRHYLDYFTSPFPLLRDFPESIPHYVRGDERVPLRFLGLPLVGAYEISLADQSPELVKCLVDQPLVLGFNYTAQ